MKVLVTGAAGFVGAHVVKHFLEQGHEVVSLDQFSDFYSVDLKKLRFQELVGTESRLYQGSIQDSELVRKILKSHSPELVIHLAAQAGVRLAHDKQERYMDSNQLGFYKILNECLRGGVENFLFASSSSVYGNSPRESLVENQLDIRPVSFYGVTKLFNELVTEPLIRGSQMKSIGMRFFTVYGPWGRPDMAYFRIATSLVLNKEFTLFGEGKLRRDFTHIDDTVKSIGFLSRYIGEIAPGSVEVINIGGGNPFSLRELIQCFEENFNARLRIKSSPANSNDVFSTSADFKKLFKATGFKPEINLKDGVARTSPWFLRSGVRENLARWSESSD